jgi:hypothetical protein
VIFVYQDKSKIPKAWLEKVAALQADLDKLATPAERKAFITKHSGVWAEIKDELLAMSHGKCWYSESPDAVSDWHVDHFRPKGRALDENRVEYPGYPWLAFDWLNYRIAGSYPNAPHKDGEGKTRGKWDYFPLADGSVRAEWDHRDFSGEICLLLDPINASDPKLMTFDEEGAPVSFDPANVIANKKVETTVHYLYLDSPRLVAARKKKWRETSDWIQEYREAIPSTFEACTAQDHARMRRLLERLATITGPERPYAATARACLRANGLGDLIKMPEEAAIAA